MLQARVDDLLDSIEFLILSVKPGVDQPDQVVEPAVQ